MQHQIFLMMEKLKLAQLNNSLQSYHVSKPKREWEKILCLSGNIFSSLFLYLPGQTVTSNGVLINRAANSDGDNKAEFYKIYFFLMEATTRLLSNKNSNVEDGTRKYNQTI